MKKVAIVGVEGSGKTVMLACLGELYTRPDENGYFLEPKNFQTAAYVMDKISRMRNGEWPVATADDVMQGLNWMLCKKKPEGGHVELCEISFLDFAGEVYRAAFGMRGGVDESLSDEIKQLKGYVSAADDLIVLINLRDVINKGASDKRVYESIWITKSILDSALRSSKSHSPRASIAITQSDSYADTIRTCGGAKRVVEAYLPHIYNSYDMLDMYDVMAVDKTILDDDGNPVPAPDFKPNGLRVLMDWIIKSGGKNLSQFKYSPDKVEIEPKAEAANFKDQAVVVQAKTHSTYLLLAFFLGMLGVHNFYAGYNGRAIVQLLISILSAGNLTPIVIIWAIIEMFVVKKDARGISFS